jgi:hypothetical protein
MFSRKVRTSRWSQMKDRRRQAAVTMARFPRGTTGEGLGPVTTQHGRDSPEEIVVIPTHVTEQTIHGLEGNAVLHRHLIPDDQVDIGELPTQLGIGLDVARTPPMQGERDLKLRVRGPTSGEQGGGDAGGSDADDGLTGGAEMAVEGAVQEGLPGPPGTLQEEVAVGRRIQHGGDDALEGVALIGVELATEGGGGFGIDVGVVGGVGGWNLGVDLGPRCVVGRQLEVGQRPAVLPQLASEQEEAVIVVGIREGQVRAVGSESGDGVGQVVAEGILEVIPQLRRSPTV